VDRFQNDPACKVFVGSVRSAGVGIDLTAADVVIHYDRWWNAAMEDQATDRVHRIGQTKSVQIIKLVTSGTVEDRIHRIITAKRQLTEDVLPEDKPEVLKQFSREELAELLREVGD
jgi:SNF2 family DNA or RNA helicase